MKVFVLKDINTDLRKFPLGSAIIYGDCIYLKKTDKYVFFNEIPKELLECKSSVDSPEVKVSIDPEENITINEIDCIRIIIYGELVDGLGGTITELAFIDKLGNKIQIEKDWVFNIDVKANLNENADWSFWNMFNNDIEYINEETGKNSSALFNVGEKNGYSEFYIKPPEEIIPILESVELLVGSPEGRLPNYIDVYLEKNIDEPEKRIETLLIHKAFDLKIDSVVPRKIIATQNVDLDNPCLFLFSNGYTDSGYHFIINPNTGKLEAIYCEFPSILIPPEEGTEEFYEFLNSLCKEDPNTIVLMKYDDGTYEKYSISEYLTKYNWICEINGCDNIVNDFELYECKQKICDAYKRNPNTIVHTFDENGNLIDMNIEDYINKKAIDCNNLSFVLSQPLYKLNIDELNELLNKIDNLQLPYITMIEPLTGEKYNVPLPDFKQKIIEMIDTNYSSVNNVVSSSINYYIEQIKNTIDKKIDDNGIVIINETNFAPIDDNEDENYTKPIFSFISLYPIDKEKLNINIENIKIDYDFNYQIIQTPIEIPLFDENGEPIDKDGDGKQDTTTVYSIKVIINSLPDTLIPNLENYTTLDLSMTYNNKLYNLNLTVYKPTLYLTELSSYNQYFTKPLKQIDEKTYLKKFEYDENGAIIKFFGAKNYIGVSNPDEKLFDIEVIYDEDYKPSQGYIKITPNNIDPNTIDKLNNFECKISDGESELTLILYVTKHLRVKDINNKNYFERYGYIMVGDKIYFPIFNDNNSIVVNKSGFLNLWHGSLSGPCVFFGAKIYTENKENGYFAVIEGVHKSVEPNNTYQYYIVDSFFNPRNAEKGLIDKEDIIYYEIEVRVEDKIKTDVDKIIIDKYRYYNSKLGFVENYLSTIGDAICKTSDLIIENFGNGFTIETDNDLGYKISNVPYCQDETQYYECKYGVFTPLKLRIDTNNETQLGKFNIILKDEKSEKIIPVEIIETIDFNLIYSKSMYDLGDVLITETKTINYLHPYLNVVNISISDDIVEYILDDENKEITFIPKKIGETYIYIGDSISINKLRINIIYPDILCFEYNIFEIKNNDFEEYEIKYLNNYSNNIEIYDYDSENLDITLDTENNSIYVRNKQGNVGEYKVTIVEKLDTGDRYATTTIRIVNAMTYVSNTINYALPSSNGEAIINTILLNLEPENEEDITIIKLEATDGINCWLEVNEENKTEIHYTVEEGIFTGEIYVYYSNGDISTIPIIVKPNWDLKEDKIIFITTGDEDDSN